MARMRAGAKKLSFAAEIQSVGKRAVAPYFPAAQTSALGSQLPMLPSSSVC